jgi:hypothetical protein
MHSIIAGTVGRDAPLGFLDTFGWPCKLIDLGEDSSARDAEAALAAGGAGYDLFLLAIGAGAHAEDPIVDAQWDEAVLKPLQTAFAALTMASRIFRSKGGGTIMIALPSPSLTGEGKPSAGLVLLRAILGLAESLRAELSHSPLNVGILFYDSRSEDGDIARRFADLVASRAMYSLSSDLTRVQITAYFEPMVAALQRTSEGPPLPDIGPMAAVYDGALGRPTADGGVR